MTVPFACDACGRRLGERRFHCLINRRAVLCIRCLGDRELHARYHPDCGVSWHDMYDHDLAFATAAAARLILAEYRNPQHTGEAPA